MDNRYPSHSDSHQGGYPRGYPPGGSPNHPGSGALFWISAAIALVGLIGSTSGRRFLGRLSHSGWSARPSAADMPCGLALGGVLSSISGHEV